MLTEDIDEATGLGRGGRISRQRKCRRGEDLRLVSRELGVTAATLYGLSPAPKVFVAAFAASAVAPPDPLQVSATAAVPSPIWPAAR